jgi:hypothetical protein
VAIGLKVGVVGLLRGKKEKGDGVGCWAGKKHREGLALFFSFLFQPFTHKIFSSFQKLF